MAHKGTKEEGRRLSRDDDDDYDTERNKVRWRDPLLLPPSGLGKYVSEAVERIIKREKLKFCGHKSLPDTENVLHFIGAHAFLCVINRHKCKL